jgi:hypothetical protein
MTTKTHTGDLPREAWRDLLPNERPQLGDRYYCLDTRSWHIDKLPPDSSKTASWAGWATQTWQRRVSATQAPADKDLETATPTPQGQTHEETGDAPDLITKMKDLLAWIWFQSDSWSNTGDNRSLRDAMKLFAARIDALIPVRDCWSRVGRISKPKGLLSTATEATKRQKTVGFCKGCGKSHILEDGYCLLHWKPSGVSTDAREGKEDSK